MKKSLLLLILLITYSFSNTYPKKLNQEFFEKVVDQNNIIKLLRYGLLENKRTHFTINKYYLFRTKQILIDKIISQNLDSSQFVSIIDLSKQLYMLFLYNFDSHTIDFIGMDFISSGNIEKEKDVKTKEDHYLKTPSGSFTSLSGWRSSGKITGGEDIKGYGEKDTFVYYFGIFKSKRYNTFDKNGTKLTNKDSWEMIEDKLHFAMHAHSLTNLLGTPSSHGCIRASSKLINFLDENLVLHKNKIKDSKWIYKKANPPKEIKNISIAGNYLFVVDSI